MAVLVMRREERERENESGRKRELRWDQKEDREEERDEGGSVLAGTDGVLTAPATGI